MIIAFICELKFADIQFLRTNTLLDFCPFYILGFYWCILGYKNIVVDLKERFK